MANSNDDSVVAGGGQGGEMMRAVRFRPCIDLHEGKVKQIVGSTLSASGETTPGLETNFETAKSPADFAEMYKRDSLRGGHVIMLGGGCEEAALAAIRAFPGGFHVGGGVNPSNAMKYLDAGASHVIVTSYVFKDGEIDWDRLEEMRTAVGKNRLVLDLSCRRRPGGLEQGDFLVVTNKWQKFTRFPVTRENLERLAAYCDEFLVHGVDAEGKMCGVLEDLVSLLGDCSPRLVTYAGGASCLKDLDRIQGGSEALEQPKTHPRTKAVHQAFCRRKLDAGYATVAFDVYSEAVETASARLSLSGDGPPEPPNA
ncbi:unnamed protein product [Pylaiella littoralis]